MPVSGIEHNLNTSKEFLRLSTVHGQEITTDLEGCEQEVKAVEDALQTAIDGLNMLRHRFDGVAEKVGAAAPAMRSAFYHLGVAAGAKAADSDTLREQAVALFKGTNSLTEVADILQSDAFSQDLQALVATLSAKKETVSTLGGIVEAMTTRGQSCSAEAFPGTIKVIEDWQARQK